MTSCETLFQSLYVCINAVVQIPMTVIKFKQFLCISYTCRLTHSTNLLSELYTCTREPFVIVMFYIILTLTLFPYPAKKGFFVGGNNALISRRQLILNSSGFRSITSLKDYAYRLTVMFIFVKRHLLTITKAEIWISSQEMLLNYVIDVTYLWKAEIRELGESNRGPSGNASSPCFTLRR